MIPISSSNKKSLIYWVGKPNHTDIFTQGYIGFTSSSFKKRWREHVSDAARFSKYPIHRAIRKYSESGLIFKIICIADADYCLSIERKLRPERDIGWNICPGGGAPGLGRKLSDEHKLAISIAQKGRKRTDAERKAVSDAGKGRCPNEDSRKLMSIAAKNRGFSEVHKKNISLAKKGVASTNGAWLHPAADIEKWAMSGEYFDLYNHGYGRIPSSQMLGFDGDAFRQILRKMKNGWNPWHDPEFLNWKRK